MEHLVKPSIPEAENVDPPERPSWDFVADTSFKTFGVTFDVDNDTANAFRPHERFPHMGSALNGTLRYEDAVQRPILSRNGIPISPRLVPSWSKDEHGNTVIKGRDEYINPFQPSPIARVGRAVGRVAFHYVPGVRQIYELGRIAGGHGSGHDHGHNKDHHPLTEAELVAKEKEELEAIKERLPLNKDLYRSLLKIDHLRLVRAKRGDIADAMADQWKIENNTTELSPEVIAEIRNVAHEQALVAYAEEFAAGDTSPKVIRAIRLAAKERDLYDGHMMPPRRLQSAQRLRGLSREVVEAMREAAEDIEDEEPEIRQPQRPTAPRRPHPATHHRPGTPRRDARPPRPHQRPHNRDPH